MYECRYDETIKTKTEESRRIFQDDDSVVKKNYVGFIMNQKVYY